MKENSSETLTTAPKVQKFDRLQSIEREHKDALERAVSLNIPHAVITTEDEDDNGPQESTSPSVHSAESEEQSSANKLAPNPKDDSPMGKSENSSIPNSKTKRTNWNVLAERLFERTDSGNLRTRKDITVTDSSQDVNISIS